MFPTTIFQMLRHRLIKKHGKVVYKCWEIITTKALTKCQNWAWFQELVWQRRKIISFEMQEAEEAIW